MLRFEHRWEAIGIQMRIQLGKVDVCMTHGGAYHINALDQAGDAPLAKTHGTPLAAGVSMALDCRHQSYLLLFSWTFHVLATAMKEPRPPSAVPPRLRQAERHVKR